MYRIYIRTHQQTVHHKTTTDDPRVAEIAFRSLMSMRKFWATRSSAVLSLDGRQLEFRRFDRIVPVDQEMAERLRRGEAIPDVERLLYPDDRARIELLPDNECLVCTVKQAADAPFFDPNLPVRLFHE